jgi:hypothetical protein
MTGKQLEKILKNHLVGYFKEKCYVFSHEYENTYFTNKENFYQIKLEVQSNSRSIGYADFTLTYWNVEDLILEIGLPNRTPERMIDIHKSFSTIHDKDLRAMLKYDKLNPIETEEDCIKYCQRIMNYMETDGQTFIEKYSYLPNILAEMDRLESEGRYWSEILSGSADNLFRGLIISRLCNDRGFENKLDYVDKIFYDDPDEWIPYYERLKERLKTIEPVYNV